MNARVILSALASTVVVFVLGYAVFGVLLHDWYVQQTIAAKSLANDPPVLWALFLAEFLISLLLAVIFERYAGIRTWSGGAVAGLWIGFLVWMFFNLAMFAFYRIASLQFAFIDGLLATAIEAVNGALIGLFLGLKRA